jgi:diaminopimelate epimerase
VTDGGWAFLKGHGTGNDFVLLPDPYGELDLTPELVAAVCDRRSGLGADGVLRVIRSAASAESAAYADQAAWFMDYRNADGTLAEMCGNGARVFARHLVDSCAEQPGRFAIATRAGVKKVDVPLAGDVTVDMGPARLDGPADVTVAVADGAGGPWPAVAVDMGNPHAVAFVVDLAEAGRLLDPPDVTPAGSFPRGVNVEFVAERGPAHVAMRVFERGVGQTQSCGTGACAAFAAARGRPGADPSDRWIVDVPGGRLRLHERSDGGIDLTGPAEIVAAGTLDPGWLAAHGS